MNKGLFILIFFVICSCASETKKEGGFNYPLSNNLSDSLFYFPDIFKKNRDDSFVLSHVSEFFCKVNVENLSNKPLIEDTYRFTYLRSFDGPIVIIITNDSITLMKDYFGKEISKIPISRHEFKTILKSIDTYGFWKMKNTNNVLAGLDGSEWILEANTSDKYNFVYSWEPSGDFAKLCYFFLKYSGLKSSEIY